MSDMNKYLEHYEDNHLHDDEATTREPIDIFEEMVYEFEAGDYDIKDLYEYAFDEGWFAHRDRILENLKEVKSVGVDMNKVDTELLITILIFTPKSQIFGKLKNYHII